MIPLFPVDKNYPEGFSYHPDFITVQEEEELLQEIKKVELHTFVFQGYEAKRKVASFGYDYNFDKRQLREGKAVPPAFVPLITKVAAFLALNDEAFAELLITEYPEGAVINWHRDAPPFDLIAGISLLSDCRFRLRPQDKKMQNRSAILSFPVERRSLYVIRGPARINWQHSIAPVKDKRFSITMRTIV